MRIAFPLIGGGDWTGGRNYLLNLIRALVTYYPDEVTPVLFCGEDVASSETESFLQLPGIELVRSDALDRKRRLRSLLLSLAFGADHQVKSLFDEKDIDVVFETAQFFGSRLGIPAIAWLPDFQHRHLPWLFSPFAKLKRELGFRAQIKAGRTVMLSSLDACGDCERFYPVTKGCTHAVSFAVPSPRVTRMEAAREIADSYGLPREFFYLPNQFWVHKNHLLVAEALSILKRQGRNIVVVASGNTRDPRNPQHYERLCELIRTHGIEEQFRMLGMIPYEHLGDLMRASVALINPSLFEGWSTTVEEARSQGVPLILSDLSVHHEQAGENAIYFSRKSADSLADVLAGFSPLSDEERDFLVKKSAEEAVFRVKSFAKSFLDTVRLCSRGQSL